MVTVRHCQTRNSGDLGTFTGLAPCLLRHLASELVPVGDTNQEKLAKLQLNPIVDKMCQEVGLAWLGPAAGSRPNRIAMESTVLHVPQ